MSTWLWCEMGRYSIATIDILVDKIKSHPDKANIAIKDTLNKTATFSKRLSVETISKTVTLNKSYINRHIKVKSRASPSNLRVVIQANTRATLLPRFSNVKTADGYKVAINRTGGYRAIKGAWMASTRGSGRKAIYVSNKQARDTARKGLRKGAGATQAKRSRLQRLTSLAAEKPNGMQALHSRSINQLFTSVRSDISPEANNFMRETMVEYIRGIT